MNNKTYRKTKEVDLLLTLIKDRLYKCEDVVVIEAIDLLQEKIDEERFLRIQDKYDTDYNSTKDCAKAMYHKREELEEVENDLESKIGTKKS